MYCHQRNRNDKRREIQPNTTIIEAVIGMSEVITPAVKTNKSIREEKMSTAAQKRE